MQLLTGVPKLYFMGRLLEHVTRAQISDISGGLMKEVLLYGETLNKRFCTLYSTLISSRDFLHKKPKDLTMNIKFVTKMDKAENYFCFFLA